jgi:hypothetical protein
MLAAVDPREVVTRTAYQFNYLGAGELHRSTKCDASLDKPIFQLAPHERSLGERRISLAGDDLRCPAGNFLRFYYGVSNPKRNGLESRPTRVRFKLMWS